VKRRSAPVSAPATALPQLSVIYRLGYLPPTVIYRPGYLPPTVIYRHGYLPLTVIYRTVLYRLGYLPHWLSTTPRVYDM
jgi:hypothetical protein